MLREVDFVTRKLARMRRDGIWPGGPRYLWTDAFGVVLLVSLHRETGDAAWLDRAEEVVADVERVLGRERGLRIGEAPDRDGQYYHYLAMWIYALARLGTLRDGYRARALRIAREIHPAFVIPGRGVVWKMREDLSAPYPGTGLGAIDPFHGYVVCRLVDEQELAPEIAELGELVRRADAADLRVDQDLGLGMMLWLGHFFPEEGWAARQRARALEILDGMWIDPPGYFCRHPGLADVRFAFTNAGVAVGLQASDAWPGRVDRLVRWLETHRSGDAYDTDAITHVMGCCARLPGDLVPGGPAPLS